MQWKLNKITNNHNKKEAWRSPSFASFSHLALCSLPDLVPVRGAPELLHFWSCNAVTAISEFLLLSSFHCSVLTIFLVDGLKIKMVAGGCRATAGRRQKMRCGGTGEGRPHKGVLEISRRHFENHHLGFVVSYFSLLCLTLGIFRTLGGRIWVFKNGNHYCWAERIVVWLSSEPPYKSYMVTLHPGSVFLMEILALTNDWVN